ncbi:MAG TPA: hypothetical protein VIT63_01290 [Nitrospira sp.]
MTINRWDFFDPAAVFPQVNALVPETDRVGDILVEIGVLTGAR